MSFSLVLASNSTIRKQLLEQSGIEKFMVMPANIDEDAIREDLVQAGVAFDEMAAQLAHVKARQVAMLLDGDSYLVVGADQLLVFEDTLWAKPKSRADLQQRLMLFQGKTHRLYTACVLYQGGREIWRFVTKVDMNMRSLSPEFIQHYVDEIDAETLNSVGGYQIENRGVQLFSHIEGDYHAILGLPLCPLLEMLRQWNILER